MTNFIIRQAILFWTIYSLFIPAISAQNIEETLAFADKQFEQANYGLALKEYQRVLFFNDGQNLQHIYGQIAASFFYKKNYKNAAYYYELSYKTAESDNIKTEILFKKASCFMLDEKFKPAIIELMNLPDSLDVETNKRKHFYFAVCYWGIEDFEKAKNNFLEILPKEKNLARDEIVLLLSKKKNLYRPNPKTAKILSVFIPGAGQLYSGDFKNGINSTALTGSFVVLGVFLAQHYSLFDAILTSTPWFMRYYQGGYKNAKKIAIKKRAIRRDKTYRRILKLL